MPYISAIQISLQIKKTLKLHNTEVHVIKKMMTLVGLMAYHLVFLPSLLPILIPSLTKTPAKSQKVSHVLQLKKTELWSQMELIESQHNHSLAR